MLSVFRDTHHASARNSRNIVSIATRLSHRSFPVSNWHARTVICDHDSIGMESLRLNQPVILTTREYQHQRTASFCRDDDRMGHDRDTENLAGDCDPDWCPSHRLWVEGPVGAMVLFVRAGEYSAHKTQEIKRNHYWQPTCMLFCDGVWSEMEMRCNDRRRRAAAINSKNK